MVYRAAQAHDLAWGAVRRPEENLHDTQYCTRGGFVEIDHEEVGPLPYTAAPWIADKAPWRLHRWAPRLGEHNDEVYGGEFGMTTEQRRRLRAAITIKRGGAVMVLETYDPLKDEMLCFLAPDGTYTGPETPPLDNEQVRKMYREMLLLRIYDRKAVSLQRQGRFGTYAQMEGQEASLVASTYPLQPQDWMVATYRETGSIWLHGVPLSSLSLYWMGNEFGSNMPEGVRVLPLSIPVGSHPLHAVGLAYAGKYRQDGSIAMTYFGDGATSEGDVHEAMNLAGVYQLPCVFFCQNNQYAISVPVRQQSASPTIAQKAVAYGFPGVRVDGNDVFAVYQAVNEAVQRARQGEGPSLIEAYTYRLGAHTTADDPTKYRDAAEEEVWRQRDPLTRVQGYLRHRGQWSEDWEHELLETCTAEVEDAMNEAEATPLPPPQDMFRYMYAAMPPALKEQEAALLNTLQQKG